MLLVYNFPRSRKLSKLYKHSPLTLVARKNVSFYKENVAIAHFEHIAHAYITQIGHHCIVVCETGNMTIKVGDKLPSVDLYEGSPQNKVNIAELAAGKKLVIFGLMGAYTPVCSKSHLPGYYAKVDEFKKNGVDDIICIAVNDPYVMKSWGDYTNVSGVIRLLADTNAEFTKAAGLDVDMTEKLGNVRCKRFALYADDGVVKHLNIEPDAQGLTVSSAEVMLDTIALA